MSATLNPQSSAPSFSLATLREILAKITAAYPERGSRLIKAAAIVAVRTLERYPHGGIWFVESECEAGNVYTMVPTRFGDLTCGYCPFGPMSHPTQLRGSSAVSADAHKRLVACTGFS